MATPAISWRRVGNRSREGMVMEWKQGKAARNEQDPAVFCNRQRMANTQHFAPLLLPNPLGGPPLSWKTPRRPRLNVQLKTRSPRGLDLLSHAAGKGLCYN